MNNLPEICAITLAVLELVTRIIPTTKDFAPLSLAIKLLNVFIPNRKIGGGKL